MTQTWNLREIKSLRLKKQTSVLKTKIKNTNIIFGTIASKDLLNLKMDWINNSTSFSNITARIIKILGKNPDFLQVKNLFNSNNFMINITNINNLNTFITNNKFQFSFSILNNNIYRKQNDLLLKNNNKTNIKKITNTPLSQLFQIKYQNFVQ